MERRLKGVAVAATGGCTPTPGAQSTPARLPGRFL